MSKVALVRCDSYDEETVCAAVARGLTLLGGPQAFFKPGERIVLKPNILGAAAVQHRVTTDPAVFAAVARAIGEAGVKLSYGDSPAIGPCAWSARAAGIEAAAQRLGVPLADFDNGRNVQYTQARMNATFPIANGILDADGVVSIPKLKTHNLTRMTGAMKNQYGCIPGMKKAQFHARFLLPQDFSEFVADVTGFVRPRLYVMDAVIAMEGNGPNTGDPKKLGLLMLSADPVAMDTVACAVMDIDPLFVPTNTAGERAGLGTCRLENIECVGDPLSDFIDRGFNIIRKPPLGLTGTGIRRVVKDMVAPRPVIDTRRCTRCGRCVDICPVEPKAVQWTTAGKQRPPRHDYGRCIRCFCCQEACPSRAITVKTPLPGRFVPYAAGAVLQAATWKSRVVRRLRLKKGNNG